jgi:hypothetical protein
MGYTVSWEPARFTDYTYNNVITVLQKVLTPGRIFRLEKWGFVIGDNENDSMGFSRDGQQMCWEKTNRLPYTKDVMKALILMVEFGVTQNLNHDDDSMAWYLTALDETHAVVPLASYEMQKRYFVELEQRNKAEVDVEANAKY